MGQVTAIRFVAVIDDPTRFDAAHRVMSYVGLVGVLWAMWRDGTDFDPKKHPVRQLEVQVVPVAAA